MERINRDLADSHQRIVNELEEALDFSRQNPSRQQPEQQTHNQRASVFAGTGEEDGAAASRGRSRGSDDLMSPALSMSNTVILRLLK